MMIPTSKKIPLALRKSLFFSFLFCASNHLSFGAGYPQFGQVFEHLFRVIDIPPESNIGTLYAIGGKSEEFDYRVQIKPYIQHLQLQENKEYDDISKQVDLIDKLKLFKNDAIKGEYFDKLEAYHVDNPEELLTVDEIQGVSHNPISAEQWIAAKDTIANIRKAIHTIKSATTYGQLRTGDINKSTKTAKFIVYCLLKENVTLANFQALESVLLRTGALLAKRRSLDREEDKKDKAQRKQMKRQQLQHKIDLEKLDKTNEAKLKEVEIQDQANQRRLAQEAQNAVAERQRLEQEARERLEADNENKEKNRQTDIAKTQLKWDNVKDIVKDTFDYLTSPKFAGSSLGIFAGGVFFYYTIKGIIKLVFKDRYKVFMYYYNPQAWWGGDKMPPVDARPILEPELQKVVDDIFDNFIAVIKMRKQKKTIANKLELPNYILTGDGGLGKTLTAFSLAHELKKIDPKHFAFIFFSASATLQMPDDQARKAWVDLFEQVENNKKKGIVTIVVIDEADSIFSQRSAGIGQSSSGNSELRTDIVNLTLAAIPKIGDTHVCYIMITNRKLDNILGTRFFNIEYLYPRDERIDAIADRFLNLNAKEYNLSIDPTIRDPRNREEIRAILYQVPPRQIEGLIKKYCNYLIRQGKTRIEYQGLKEEFERMIRLKKQSEIAAQRRHNNETAPPMVAASA